MTLERSIALYCVPALAGIKPSNLLSYSTEDKRCAYKELSRLNRQLNASGIYLKVICEYEKRLLILVYRNNKLANYLDRSEIAAFLKNCGYGVSLQLADKISLLSERIKNSREFPHEVGAFLGYPIEDIYGFINHKSCKYTGYWKVYGNVEQAKDIFRKYDSCRNAVVNRMSMGKTLTDMFALA